MLTFLTLFFLLSLLAFKFLTLPTNSLPTDWFIYLFNFNLFVYLLQLRPATISERGVLCQKLNLFSPKPNRGYKRQGRQIATTTVMALPILASRSPSLQVRAWVVCACLCICIRVMCELIIFCFVLQTTTIDSGDSGEEDVELQLTPVPDSDLPTPQPGYATYAVFCCFSLFSLSLLSFFSCTSLSPVICSFLWHFLFHYCCAQQRDTAHFHNTPYPF